MRFFGLKSCDTCRKALKALVAAGHAPEVIDVRGDGISAADIEMIIKTFPDKAINRASTTWRALTDDEKARDPAALLAAHPTLLKRPVIEDRVWTVGWGADVQAQWCGQGPN
jgi:arsenate reductase-like glutaredoxin family protein